MSTTLPVLHPKPPLQFYFMHILNTDLCHGFVTIKINKTVRESAGSDGIVNFRELFSYA